MTASLRFGESVNRSRFFVTVFIYTIEKWRWRNFWMSGHPFEGETRSTGAVEFAFSLCGCECEPGL